VAVPISHYVCLRKRCVKLHSNEYR